MLDPVSWPCNEFSPCAPNPIIFSCPLSLRPIPFPIFRYTTSSFLIISNPSFLPHSTFCALSCLLTYSVAANFFHPDKRCCKVSFCSPHSLKISTSPIPFSFFQPLVSMICYCILKITAVFFWISIALPAIHFDILILSQFTFFSFIKSLSSLRLCSFFNYVPVSYTHLTLPTNREV